MLAGAAWFATRERPGGALALLMGAAAGLAVAGRWAARDGVLSLPVARRDGINLVATRGTPTPRVWLVAHLDSKSQPVPIAARAAGITITALVWAGAIGLAGAQVAGAVGADGVRGAWVVIAIVGVTAAVPIVASVVGDRSPGALDNASGVAAVLVAAEAVDRDLPLGVLLTSAEELGLAGARAWARAWRAAGYEPAIAVNCDGVDDAGALTCMYTGRRPVTLMEVAESAPAVRVRRLVPGILVDGVALADAGWQTITVSKGTLGTLARIHTPRDTARALTGAGIATAAAFLASLVAALVALAARVDGPPDRNG